MTKLLFLRYINAFFIILILHRIFLSTKRSNTRDKKRRKTSKCFRNDQGLLFLFFFLLLFDFYFTICSTGLSGLLYSSTFELIFYALCRHCVPRKLLRGFSLGNVQTLARLLTVDSGYRREGRRNGGMKGMERSTMRFHDTHAVGSLVVVILRDFSTSFSSFTSFFHFSLVSSRFIRRYETHVRTHVSRVQTCT